MENFEKIGKDIYVKKGCRNCSHLRIGKYWDSGCADWEIDICFIKNALKNLECEVMK